MDLNKPWGWRGAPASAGPLSSQVSSSAASMPTHTQLPPSEEAKLAQEVKGKVVSRGIDAGIKKAGEMYTQYSSPTLGAGQMAPSVGQGAPLAASGQMPVEGIASSNTAPLAVSGQMPAAEVASSAATDAAATAAADAATSAATSAATDAATSAATDAATSAATGAAVDGASSAMGSMVPFVGAAAAAAQGKYGTAAANAIGTYFGGPLVGAAAGTAAGYLTGYSEGTTAVPALGAGGFATTYQMQPDQPQAPAGKGQNTPGKGWDALDYKGAYENPYQYAIDSPQRVRDFFGFADGTTSVPATGGKGGSASPQSGGLVAGASMSPLNAKRVAPVQPSLAQQAEAMGGNNGARAAAGARFAPELFGAVPAQGSKGGSTASAPATPARSTSTAFTRTPTVAQQTAAQVAAMPPVTKNNYTMTPDGWDNPSFSGGY